MYISQSKRVTNDIVINYHINMKGSPKKHLLERTPSPVKRSTLKIAILLKHLLNFLPNIDRTISNNLPQITLSAKNNLGIGFLWLEIPIMHKTVILITNIDPCFRHNGHFADCARGFHFPDRLLVVLLGQLGGGLGVADAEIVGPHNYDSESRVLMSMLVGSERLSTILTPSLWARR